MKQERKTFKRALAAIAALVCAFAFSSLAFADTIVSTKPLSAWPTDPTEFYIGHGDVTGIHCIGDDRDTGEIWFDCKLYDETGFFGHTVTLSSAIKCIDPVLAAPGTSSGTMHGEWPLSWSGEKTYFDAMKKNIDIVKDVLG